MFLPSLSCVVSSFPFQYELVEMVSGALNLGEEFRTGLDQCPHKRSLLLTCDIASVDVFFFRCELALENLDTYSVTVLLCGCLQSCSMHSSLALFAGGTKVEFTFWGTPLLVWMLPLAHCVRVAGT